MNRKNAVAVIVLSIMIGSIPTLAQSFFPSQTISTTGTLRQIGVAVFWDSNLTSYVSAVNWPILNPGENTTIQFWILNTGNEPVSLNMITENHNPTQASTHLSITWTTENQILQPLESIQSTVMLTVDPQADFTTFSFDMTIEGTQ